jgi:tetratricopeptide (TPR) repeat protein
MTRGNPESARQQLLSGRRLSSFILHPSSFPRWSAVVILLAVHGALAISAIRHKSATFDEMVRLTTGYSYWVTGDYRLDPVEPPLSKLWAALPLLWGHYRFPDLNQPAWWVSDAESMGRQFFFGLGNDTSAMLFHARAMMALLSVGLGLLVYLWSRRLFGEGGGMLSLWLYAFCPNMLAHAPLVTTETATCLFFVASVAGLWWVLHRVTVWSVLASGAALAGLFCSKMSAPLIIVAGFLMLALRLASAEPLEVRLGRGFTIRRRAAKPGVWAVVIVAQVLITAGGLWAVHGFRYEARINPVPLRDRFCAPGLVQPKVSEWDYVLSDSGAVGAIVGFFRDHRLLPEAYLYGVALQAKVIGAGYGFLNGQRRITGWWYFFPYAFLVKTPLGLFGLLALAVGIAVSYQLSAISFRRSRETEPRCASTRTRAEGSVFGVRGSVQEASVAARNSAVLAVLIFLAVYWVAAVQANINIGHRHILPTYPFLYVLAGAVVLAWQRGSPGARFPSRTRGRQDSDLAANAGKDSSDGSREKGFSHERPEEPVAASRGLWRISRWLLLGCSCLFVLASVAIYPNYLAYFNVLVGGPRNAYRHLVDSSLDWGQDLPGLKRWLDAHATPGGSGPSPRVYLSYFGTDNPDRFGIRATMLPSHMEWRPPEFETLGGGVYVISATMLQVMYIMPTNAWTETFEAAYQLLRAQYEAQTQPAAPTGEASEYRLLRFARLCSALRRRPPDDQINYTLLVYRLTDAQLREILDGPPVELAADSPVDGGLEHIAWFQRLARMCARRGLTDKAVEQYRRLLACYPEDSDASASLAQTLIAHGDYESASTVLRQALDRTPDHIDLLNTFAWLKATCPVDRFRDGGEAIRLAQRALRVAGQDRWELLDTLAAAYAEAGRCPEAAHLAEQAAELARQAGLQPQAERIAQRAALYRAGKPFRLPSQTPTTRAAIGG